MALGDFGGTSSIDVAVTKLNTNAVTVLLNTTIPGTTTVTFAAPLDTPVGSLPLALTAGNFDGDSTLDLAVANFGGNSVAILLGTGTGTFILAPASPIVVGANPRSLAAGDLNGDGFADLAIANYTDNTVAILAGAGTGLFGPAVPYPVGAGPQSLAVADLNGDTVVDVVTTNQVADGVSVLLNSAATPGTFASAAAYPSGDNPYAVAVGNLDADGLPDLAVANNDGNTVAVLLNVPSAPGTFTAPSPPASAARSRSM